MISLPKAEEDALEEEEEEELGDWMQDIELDAELFANDSAEEEKPLVGIGASTLADMGDGGMGGSKTTEDTGAGDGASAIRTEGKRTYNVSPSLSCRISTVTLSADFFEEWAVPMVSPHVHRPDGKRNIASS